MSDKGSAGGIVRGKGAALANLENVTSSTFFTGGYNTHTLPMDPLVVGYAFIKWTKLPSWFEKQCPWFAPLSEKNLKGFNGNDDQEISGVDASAGFTGNTSQFAGAMGGKGQGFSLTHNEFSGSPMATAYNFWVSSIRDPHSGIALYPTYDKGATQYSAANHTGELLYVVLKPDVGAGAASIEAATYYTNVMPTKMLRSMWNFTAGSQESPQVEMSFFGDRWYGAGVDNFASTMLSSFASIMTLQSANVGNFGA